MKNTIKKTLAVALACLAANAANAESVQIREAGLAQGLWSNALQLPAQGGIANYWTGLQTIIVNESKQLLAFCIDPWEWSPNSNRTYAASNDLTTYFGASKANLVRELYADAYSGTQLPALSGGNLNAAAFQLALWEIIADSSINLTTGAVRTVTGTNSQIVNAAELLLANLGNGSNSNDNYAFELYSNGKSMGSGAQSGFQDYLVVHRVPEPATGALILAALALGATGVHRRRRV